MEKRMLKFSSLLLVPVLLLAVISGCSGSQKSGQEGSKAETAQTGEAEGNANGERVQLTVEVYDRGTQGQTPVDNNYWTKWIQEKFGDPNNIDVKLVPCPRSQEVQMLNVWMAANQAPDISFTYNTSVVYNYYKNNGLVDLTTALDQYGTDLKAYLGEEVLSYGKFNGKQFAIPAKRVVQAQTCTYIRKDWLDKLSLGIPDTTEQFYDALKAFKEKNPGNVDKVVPFAMKALVRNDARGFFEVFLEEVSDRDYYINSRLFLPGYKEGARFLNKMYNEGLISPEFPIDKDGAMLNQDVIRGVAGSFNGVYDFALRDVPGYIKNLKANIPDAELVPCDPYTNKYTDKHSKQIAGPVGLSIIVPKSGEKKAAEVIKYLNWMSGKDILFFLQYGNEGIGYTMVDGIPKVNQVKGEQMFPSAQNIDYTLIVNGVDTGDPEKTIKANAMAYPGLEDVYRDALELAMRDGYVLPTLPVLVDAEAKYTSNLEEKEEEIYSKAITAKPQDFDNVWDTQLKEYLAAGGQEIIDQRTQAWKGMYGDSADMP